MKIPLLALLVVALGIPFVSSAAPPNDLIEDAIEIDATSGTTISGDTTGATIDFLPFGWCGAPSGNGVWYKIKDNFDTNTAITISTCLEGTEIDSTISVIKAKYTDCDCGICVGGVDDLAEDKCHLKAEYTFLASEHDPFYYYILVTDWGEPGKFELKVHTNSSYFNVIDAKNNRFVEVLNDFIKYWDPMPKTISDQLNIQAVFSPELSVKSVRVQYDDRHSRCENAEPFSVFGDKHGNYYGESMTPGAMHTVSATPYTKEKCKGAPGTPIVKDFEVHNCFVSVYIYDVNQDAIIDQIVDHYYTPSLPCNVNAEFIPSCRFEIEKLRMVLREKETNKTVHDHTEHQSPYFFFGNRKNGGLHGGSISPGNYTMTLFIDGFEQFSINFDVGDEACT